MFANKFLFFNKMAEDTKILVLVNQIDKLDYFGNENGTSNLLVFCY